MVIHSAKLFSKAQTDIKPWKPTTKIIQEGMYKFSRNPIYLGFLFLGFGFALLLNNGWLFFTQIGLGIWLDRYVIQQEEEYLEGKFGEDYIHFKKGVRRWI